MFDWRGTLFHDEENISWLRASAASIGRTLPDVQLAEISRAISEAERLPHVVEAWKTADCSVDLNRTASVLLFREAGLDDELAEAVWLRASNPAAVFPYPDTRPTLIALKQAGARVVVVSDIYFDLRPLFGMHDMLGFVDGFVHSYEVGVQKPDPLIFQRGLEVAGVEPHEALMVGDNPNRDSGASNWAFRPCYCPLPRRLSRTVSKLC